MERKVIQRAGGFRQAVGTFTLGAAVGSIVALLYAPASGRTTRKRLKLKLRTMQRSAIQLRDTAAKKIQHARAWVTAHTNGHNRRLPHRTPVHA